MGFEDLANLTHQMENVLDAIRNEKISVTPELLDVIFRAVDDLEAMVVSISEGGDGKRDVTEVVAQLKQIEKGDVVAVRQKSNSTYEQTYDEFEYTILKQSAEQGFHSYEVTIKLRSDCLLKAARVFMIFEVIEQIGEVIKSVPTVEMLEAEQFDDQFVVTVVTKVSQDELQKRIMKVSEVEQVIVQRVNLHRSTEEEKTTETKHEQKEEQQAVEQAVEKKQEAQEEKATGKQVSNKTIRVNIERLDVLMNLFEELVIDRGRLEQISRELNNPELHETVERMSRISGDLQNIILNMRMVPVETVFNRFPRMVRQLARDLGKKINLEIIGAETELDRTVIDEIGDPLVHLLRNAIDHGIETPDVRRAKGKPEEGTVKLKAYHSGNHVFIEIEDDGAGISREKVLKKPLVKALFLNKMRRT